MRRLLLLALMLFVVGWIAVAEGGLRLGGDSLREKIVELNTNSSVGAADQCSGATDGEIHYENSTMCDGDPALTFNDTTKLTTMALSADGDSVLLNLNNTQADAGSSTNETAQIRFGGGSETDRARIVFGKINDYSLAGAKDSFLRFYTESDDGQIEQLHIGGNSSTQGVGIGLTNTFPRNRLDVEGNVAVGATYSGTDSAPTNGMLIEGRVGIGQGFSSGSAINPDYFAHIKSATANSVNADLFLDGHPSDDSPAQLHLGSNDFPMFTISTSQSTTGDARPNANAFTVDFGFVGGATAIEASAPQQLSFTPGNRTGLTAEDTFFKVNSVTSSLASGIMLSDFRYLQIRAPTLNGVAGGATESIDNAATVYINAAPSGSNLTFTNGPYALWVDDGAVRFDGAVTYTSSVETSGSSPSVCLNPDTGNTVCLHMDPGGLPWVGDSAGTKWIVFRLDGGLEFPQYPNCARLSTNSLGQVQCNPT